MTKNKGKKLKNDSSTKRKNLVSKFNNKGRKIAEESVIFGASVIYQYASDGDDRCDIEDMELDSYDTSFVPSELTRHNDQQDISLVTVNESDPSIKFISQKQYDINKELLFNRDALSPAYIESQLGPAVNDVESSGCIAKTPDNNRRIPLPVSQLFREIEPRTINKIIREIQGVLDLCWNEYDQSVENEDKKSTSEEIENQVHKYFRICMPSMRYGHSYKNQILSYISNNIFRRASYGCMFINSQRQVLGVENHFGTWSAPKGHPKVNDNDEWETTKETSSRETLEEVAIKDLKREKDLITENFNQYFDLNQYLYLECNLVERQIGLYVIPIREKDFAFNLQDQKENKRCQWLDWYTILNAKLKNNGHDDYYTLRKFVEYLNDHPHCYP